ncbi:MAG: DUF2779 domain-containing protein [Rhodoferax sp.]|uniref:DUF2779 domain-containing protein n=1 Tax=Rhodoferax sp. TaxID=50421 RepID=UPI002ACEEB89|nr:DUF2779 domain-containing protein [Rhodoferax sp.]MDZ7890871.1 DUF2779 domain-containing protein [Rhodoferax sp.]
MQTPNPRYLTKSRFKLAVDCPSKLFYTGKQEYANANDGNELLAMLADGGFQVGELAKQMYPEGVEILAKVPAQAIAETAPYLGQENFTLFEPAIVVGSYLVRVDVLVKRGTSLQVIEVKAKSYSGDPASLSGKRKPIANDFLPYVQDVAFQKWVVQQAFPHCSVSASLLMPDKSKTTTVSGLNQWFKVQRKGRSTEVLVDPRAHTPGLAESVLTCISVDHLANEVINNPIDIPGGQGTMAELAKLWAHSYQADTRIAPVVGAHCRSCEFKGELGADKRSGFHECWKWAHNWTDADFANGTVLDIWNFRGKDKLIQQGVLKLKQVTDADLGVTDFDLATLSNNQRQWLQVRGMPPEHQAQGYYLDREGLAAEMRNWVYPLHLIDFETAAVALPFHAGRRPYEQVAFQFSHHTLQKDGSLAHASEFLCAEPGAFPNYAFVRALYESLRHDQGTVFRWSHHENSILAAIKHQLEQDAVPPADKNELIAFINSITKGGERAMVDLADVARKHYFHPATKGSCSIKRVLPAVLAGAPGLQALYLHPVYGAEGAIPSKNFKNMAWVQYDPTGQIIDPYKLLKGELEGVDEDEENPGINQGGAASYAYLRMQFENMDPDERKALKNGLLRYCELDTLAMALVVQAWSIDLISASR